jgi:hypothetical protein
MVVSPRQLNPLTKFDKSWAGKPMAIEGMNTVYTMGTSTLNNRHLILKFLRRSIQVESQSSIRSGKEE